MRNSKYVIKKRIKDLQAHCYKCHSPMQGVYHMKCKEMLTMLELKDLIIYYLRYNPYQRELAYKT